VIGRWRSATLGYDDRPMGVSAAIEGTISTEPRIVHRSRLTHRLLDSLPARLVLLHAPAGYSKTTSLESWASADERPFAWVRCDGCHDDPALLVTAIVDALEAIEAVDPDVLLALGAPRPDIDTVTSRLGRALEGWSTPFVLAMDDVHLLTSPGAIGVLHAIIDSIPHGSQVALAARAEPPLPLGRMRAHRQLAELGARDLAMTREEGGELLAATGVELSGSELDLILERTEGWPVALYLAGLALADQPNTRAAVSEFAGDDRLVVDYLHDEFLAATSRARVAFLTRSSLLDELTGPACDAALARSGSARLLRDLARTNALVVPLDRKDERYRYHHLFSAMLRSELRRREPDEEAKIHARASRWYADDADLERAIDHAIAAGEVEWAGELIWRAFPEFSGRGRIATLQRWLGKVGEERVESCLTLSLAAAHAHLAVGAGEPAAHWGRVAARLAKSAGRRDPIQGDLHLLDATLAPDGVARMGEDAARACELFPDDSPWNAPGYLYRGISTHLGGQPERALPMLREAARRGAIASPIIQTLALAQLGLAMADDADWEGASRLIAQACEQVQRCGLTEYPSITLVYATAALVWAHEGHVEQGHEALVRSERLLGRLADFPTWYEAEVRLALCRASVRLDDLESGRALVDEAARFIARVADAAVLDTWLDGSRAELEAAAGERRANRSVLTKSELRTLQYLPSHLSFREIGECLHLSANTVKTQARAVYRKLDVSSRAEAVDRARAGGLLAEEPPEPQPAITRSG
jgi:LuxR family maltose regulon positive regulatory protein